MKYVNGQSVRINNLESTTNVLPCSPSQKKLLWSAGTITGSPKDGFHTVKDTATQKHYIWHEDSLEGDLIKMNFSP